MNHTEATIFARSKAEMAEFFGVDPITLDRWRGRGAPMVKVDRGYDVAAVARWRLGRIGDLAGVCDDVPQETGNAATMGELKAQLAELEARLEHIKADRATGVRVLALGAVDKAVEALSRLRHDLEVLPRRLADAAALQLDETEIEAVIAKECDCIVERYASSMSIDPH